VTSSALLLACLGARGARRGALDDERIVPGQGRRGLGDSESDVSTLPDEPVGAHLVVGTFAFELAAPTVDRFDDVLLDAK